MLHSHCGFAIQTFKLSPVQCAAGVAYSAGWNTIPLGLKGIVAGRQPDTPVRCEFPQDDLIVCAAFVDASLRKFLKGACCEQELQRF
jgi:hypothetical protein